MDEEEDDPWLRQFLAGVKRREDRDNATGWGCFIFVVLVVLIVIVVSMH